MTDHPRDNDPVEPRAQRAGAGLRAGRVASTSPTIPRRRLMRRRIGASVVGVAAIAVAVVSFIAVNRDDKVHVAIQPPTTTSTVPSTTSLPAPTTTTAPSTTTPVTTTQPSTTTPLPTTNVPYPTVPEATVIPRLLTASGDGVWRVADPNSRLTVAIPTDARVAFALASCSAIAYERDPAGLPEITIAGSGCPTGHIGALDGHPLLSVGSNNGDDVLVVEAVPVSGQGNPPLLLYDVQTGAVTNEYASSKQEIGPSGSIAGGRLVINAYVGGIGALEVRSLGDASAPVIRIAAPNGDFGTRSYSLAVLDPTGTKVAFLDTPHPPGPIDEPDLVVRDIASGRELLRLSLPWPAWPTLLDYDGRFVVISRRSAQFPQDGVPLPALIIDTAASSPAFRQVGAAVGMVTLDRSAP